MKKLLLVLLAFAMAVSGISCATAPSIGETNEGAVIQKMDAAPLLAFSEGSFEVERSFETLPPSTETEPVEPNHFHDDIPLSYEEQEWLQSACEEFEVPYALALGLIEKETFFTNIVGDDGASTGYMQIQQRWHWSRMERLAETDLLDPKGNFRVGCDFLSELYGKYNDWSVALTVYNMGHNPGFVTDYAKEVMRNYARWQELLENYI